jgi:hypothetical protein
MVRVVVLASHLPLNINIWINSRKRKRKAKRGSSARELLLYMHPRILDLGTESASLAAYSEYKGH